jgi:hypothetical protein
VEVDVKVIIGELVIQNAVLTAKIQELQGLLDAKERPVTAVRTDESA